MCIDSAWATLQISVDLFYDESHGLDLGLKGPFALKDCGYKQVTCS